MSDPRFVSVCLLWQLTGALGEQSIVRCSWDRALELETKMKISDVYLLGQTSVFVWDMYFIYTDRCYTLNHSLPHAMSYIDTLSIYSVHVFTFCLLYVIPTSVNFVMFLICSVFTCILPQRHPFSVLLVCFTFRRTSIQGVTGGGSSQSTWW